MKAVLVVCALTLGCQPAIGQAPISLEALSPVDRQQADFYGAIAGTGPAVAANWSIRPARVELGGDIEMTLTVKNAVNPAELVRPNLAERPEWKALFSTIEEIPTSTPGEFKYRLKARNAGVHDLPVPKYRYYQPRLPEGRRFQAAFADAPKLTVFPAAPREVPRVRIPIDAPPEFFEDLPPTNPSAAAAEPPFFFWLLLFTSAAATVPAYIAFWRWRYPDAARLARIRRAKSVRAALDTLRKAETSTDLAERVTVAMTRYLRDRWHVPPSARTPREIAEALLANGLPMDRARAAESLLAESDRARFAGGSDTPLSLPRAAAELIRHWEGAAA